MARRLALVTGLIGLLLLAVLLLVPFAGKERLFFGTVPQPDPVSAVTLVPLRGGQEACFDEAVIDPRSEVAQFRVGTYGRPSQPLELTISGDGYRAAATVAAADYDDNELQEIPLTPPREATEVSICIANAGSARVALYGTADRAKTRSQTKVDGRRSPANPLLRFVEAKPATLTDRLGTIADRVEVFRPPFIAAWMLWTLLALVVVGVPVAIVVALQRALREDERAENL